MYKSLFVSALGFLLGQEIISLAIIAVWFSVAAYWLIKAAAEHGM